MGAHADLLKLLLPAMAYDKSGVALSAEISAEAAQLDTFQAFVAALLIETDPRTTSVLLPDWERVYGLPDACGVLGATLEERRAQLVAKVGGGGGLSLEYFVNLAVVLGYEDVTITALRPTGCESLCDGSLRTEISRLAWTVNLPHEGDNHSVFRANSVCTASLDFYLVGLLECSFVRIKSAHTFLLFTYNP